MTFVEKELQPHAVGIVFATDKTMVLGHSDVLGVMSGKMFWHLQGLYGQRRSEIRNDKLCRLPIYIPFRFARSV